MLIPNRHSGYLAGIRIYPGGKGGSSAPPPDPALIAAQIRSMGIQDSAIQDVLRISQEMAPLQKQQLQFGLDSSKTAFDQSQADRTYALERRGELTTLQDRAIADANNFDAASRGDELASQAQADVGQSFNSMRSQSARDLARMGVNPSSGKSMAMSNQMGLGEATAKAGAATAARTSARNEGYALNDRASNALNGYPGMGLQTTSAGAGFGTSGTNLANASMSGQMAGYNSASQMAGSMGSNAASMYGAQASYKNQQDQLANNDGGLFGVLGMLGGSAITKYSDRRLKENITLVGRDEPTGLNLYEFNYIGKPDDRMRGVMADEVAPLFPDAVSQDARGFDMVDYAQLGFDMVPA